LPELVPRGRRATQPHVAAHDVGLSPHAAPLRHRALPAGISPGSRAGRGGPRLNGQRDVSHGLLAPLRRGRTRAMAETGLAARQRLGVPRRPPALRVASAGPGFALGPLARARGWPDPEARDTARSLAARTLGRSPWRSSSRPKPARRTGAGSPCTTATDPRSRRARSAPPGGRRYARSWHGLPTRRPPRALGRLCARVRSERQCLRPRVRSLGSS
jgi:hypothetical protein